MSGEHRQSTCVCCGAVLDDTAGPTHAYMTSSPACYAAFNAVLACEYSDPALMGTHRLTVDAFAVQHPGDRGDRRAVQSVGLHLARLGLDLTGQIPAGRANDAMLAMARHKASLPYLEPPGAFAMTAADVAPFAGSPQHSDRVTAWARATWADWSTHHAFILNWAETARAT